MDSKIFKYGVVFSWSFVLLGVSIAIAAIYNFAPKSLVMSAIVFIVSMLFTISRKWEIKYQNLKLKLAIFSAMGIGLTIAISVIGKDPASGDLPGSFQVLAFTTIGYTIINFITLLVLIGKQSEDTLKA